MLGCLNANLHRFVMLPGRRVRARCFAGEEFGKYRKTINPRGRKQAEPKPITNVPNPAWLHAM